MRVSAIFSNSRQLEELKKILFGYVRLPFSKNVVPGAIMEAALAKIRGGEVLRTYDFIDVIKREKRIGWQVKSTQDKTPVTWKRAKISDKESLIAESRVSKKGRQSLGDAIINFCNKHIEESFEKYDLDNIGYSRLIVHASGEATYFEKLLCSKKNSCIFNPEDFTWR